MNAYEKVIEVSGRRAQELEQGTLLLDQGWKKLKHEKWNEAIQYFSRACLFLAKEEHIDDFCNAMLGISFSYELAGLFWASRAAAVVALNQIFKQYLKGENLHKYIAPIIRRIIWIELQIGRIPVIISWYKLMKLHQTAYTLCADEQEEINLIDQVMGILILKSAYDDLIQITDAPSVMENAGLPVASIMSSYALGYIEEIVKDVNDSEENISKCILELFSQPARNDLPSKPEWSITKQLILRTKVLGCEIIWITPLKKEAILYSEMVLAFIEAVFSTSQKFLMSHRSKVTCTLEISNDEKVQPSCRVQENQYGWQELYIQHPSNFSKVFNSNSDAAKFLIRILVTLMEVITVPRENGSLESLFKEKALDRAFLLSNLIMSLENILSSSYYVKWADIPKDDGASTYPCRREKEWWSDITLPAIQESHTVNQNTLYLDTSNNLFGIDAVKHSQQHVLDLINVRLWNQASWRGLAFSYSNNSLVVALLFGSEAAARKIFLGLRERIGTENKQNLEYANSFV